MRDWQIKRSAPTILAMTGIEIPGYIGNDLTSNVVGKDYIQMETFLGLIAYLKEATLCGGALKNTQVHLEGVEGSGRFKNDR